MIEFGRRNCQRCLCVRTLQRMHHTHVFMHGSSASRDFSPEKCFCHEEGDSAAD